MITGIGTPNSQSKSPLPIAVLLGAIRWNNGDSFVVFLGILGALAHALGRVMALLLL